ncbi:uncharacterized protein LOC119765333 [Culex quinquefasciatus]|uniref:uncharacterized protein LOC119765333 n=1 Tax=Culex quinquefasciatus TaxID=7176 RepID=UPI0018E3BF64|nr:uncharacterized protein LOC119765333 [Culex quinquefasciatus]
MEKKSLCWGEVNNKSVPIEVYEIRGENIGSSGSPGTQQQQKNLTRTVQQHSTEQCQRRRRQQSSTVQYGQQQTNSSDSKKHNIYCTTGRTRTPPPAEAGRPPHTRERNFPRTSLVLDCQRS